MEKELLFANTTKLTKQLFLKFKKALNKRNTRIYRFLLLIMSIILVFAGIVLYKSSWFVVIISFYIITTLLLILVSNGYIIKASLELKKLKRIQKWSEDHLDCTYEFYVCDFIWKKSEIQTVIKYDGITKLYVAKDSFVISGETNLLIDKKGFTHGNEDNFEAFLKRRNPNIQITQLLLRKVDKKNKILIAFPLILILFLGYLFIRNQIMESNGTKIFYKEDEVGIDIVFHETKENENGLIEIVRPNNLFGSDTTSARALKEVLTDGIDFNWRENYTDIVPNEDGTLSFFYTREQYDVAKKLVYQLCSLEHFINPASYSYIGTTTIKKVIFENEALTRITVLVSQENNVTSPMIDKTLVGIGIFLYVGEYQILLGADPNKWHTRITVEDMDTGEILSETEYPNEKMYILN